MTPMRSPRRTLTGRNRLVLATLAGALIVSAVGVVRAVTAWPPSTGTVRGPIPLAPSACTGTRMLPGSDLQATLDLRPEGASFCFASGVYRLTAPLRPKARQRLVAQPGAVLSGARVVIGWRRSGLAWHATDQLPANPIVHGECAGDYRGCRYAEAVFYDDRQLWRVERQHDVAPGRFYEDYEANAIWIGDDPGGHLVEVARAEAAIAGPAAGVLVEGFTIEKFANPAQQGAVQAIGRDWQVRRNDVRLNHGHGVTLHSPRGKVLGNHLHHNGQLGLAGDGEGQLVAGNEIDHNNTAGFSALWEAGGAKWGEAVRLTVRDNIVHHNRGPGLWTDINSIYVVYERNNVHANASHGIFHEIGYDALIRDNRVTDNGRSDPAPGWGGAGIRLAGSSNVEVSGNVLTGNANGVILVQQARPEWPSSHGPHELHDVDVHDNDIGMVRNVTGMVDDTGDASHYDRNNRFRHNTYRLASLDGRFFAWRDDRWDRSAWTRHFGQDTTGSFLPTADFPRRHCKRAGALHRANVFLLPHEPNGLNTGLTRRRKI